MCQLQSIKSQGKTRSFVNVALFLFLIHCGSSFSQNLAIHLIPEELLHDADAVVREQETRIEVKSLKSATISERVVVSVLNEEGKKYGHFTSIYDKNERFANIRGEVYDQNGKRIRRLRQSEISDRSFVSGISIFEDTRIKILEVHQPVFPYTVVIEYKKEYNGFVGFPAWAPQYAGNLAVQNASLTLIYPECCPVRFKTLNTDEPRNRKTGNINEYSWKVKNLTGYKDEPLSVPAYNYLPVVYLSPYDFNFHNTSGNLQTWESYGNWVAQLLKGRQELPESSQKQILELTRNVSDNPREMTRLIYEYLQNKTRYVSIQLGIGGYQPFPATMVANTGYGDCKALSNYTMALLSVAGIESYYAEIGAGSRRIRFENFPSLDQTNHAILCVPFENDTVWLECTSQRLPFGYVPASLLYRDALVVANNNSKLVKMPAPGASDNLMNLIMEIDLDASGNALASIQTTYKGTQTETVFPEVWQSNDEKREALTSRYAVPGARVTDFSIQLGEENGLHAIETLGMNISNMAARTGSRFFLNPNPFIPLRARINKIPDRRTDFQISYPFSDHKTIIYKFPENMTVENVPEELKIETSYGSYHLSIETGSNSIIVNRKFILNRGRYPADQYNDYVDFRQAVYRADRNHIVLIEQ